MYVSEDISWRRREDLESDNLEILCIEIIVKNSNNFLICSVLDNLNNQIIFQNISTNFLTIFWKNANASLNETIILGDMNINFLKKDNSKELKSIISSYNYKQLIDSVTRITNNTSALIRRTLAKTLKMLLPHIEFKWSWSHWLRTEIKQS